MSLNFVVQETTARESGESAAYPLSVDSEQNLLLTLSITHAVEQESLDLDIYTSPDGKRWSAVPALSFQKKSYCGTYAMFLPQSDARFLKASWKLSRWGQNAGRPFFRFHVTAEAAPERVMAAG